jgi:GT2 family glycosyltransferase/SAM-dependent methyltransferase
MKYSIVIPTYNHCDDLLKPCVDSILKYSNLEDIELIISYNGCTDETKHYVTYLTRMFEQKGLGDHIKYFGTEKPLGYPKATNIGIELATAEKIVLLNNDTILLEQPKNKWLELLEAPFLSNSKCGISGPIMSHSPETNRDFIIFFCAMIDRKVFDTIGLLNEEYGTGSGEDTEFCIEAVNAGFEQFECLPKKILDEHSYTGDFPIYHVGEATVQDKNLVQNWKETFYKNGLRLAKKYNPEHYRFLLSNNYERAVFLKGDAVFPRETQRYQWAAQNVLPGSVLEIGCSTGYGYQFLQSPVYMGLDYDPLIVEVAKEQEWSDNATFYQADINTYELGMYTNIVAFEVIEHLDNGLEIVEKLKKHCKRLLITVPHNEPKGFWGEHHRLHGLTEKDFPGFKFEYINHHGGITDTMVPVDNHNPSNLMICRWDNE